MRPVDLVAVPDGIDKFSQSAAIAMKVMGWPDLAEEIKISYDRTKSVADDQNRVYSPSGIISDAP